MGNLNKKLDLEESVDNFESSEASASTLKTRKTSPTLKNERHKTTTWRKKKPYELNFSIIGGEIETWPQVFWC